MTELTLDHRNLMAEAAETILQEANDIGCDHPVNVCSCGLRSQASALLEAAHEGLDPDEPGPTLKPLSALQYLADNRMRDLPEGEP